MESCKNCIHYKACKFWLDLLAPLGIKKSFPFESERGDLLCEYYEDLFGVAIHFERTNKLLDDIDAIITNNVVEQHYHGNHFVPTSVDIGIVGELKKLREKYGG